MGDKGLEPISDGIQKDFYSIVVYRGIDLPDQYRNMVLSKWMRTLRYGNDYFKLIDSDNYYKNYQVYIKEIVQREGSFIKMAVLADDHDIVLAWSAYEGSTLHYLHVNFEYRNQGLGKALLPKDLKAFTHLTKAGMSIWQNKFPQVIFNPFL